MKLSRDKRKTKKDRPADSSKAEPSPKEPGKPKSFRSLFEYGSLSRFLLIGLLVVGGVQLAFWYFTDRNTRSVSYSEFKDAVRSQKFSQAVISKEWAEGTLKHSSAGDEESSKTKGNNANKIKSKQESGENNATRWRTTRIPGDDTLVSLLDESGIEYEYVPEVSIWFWLLSLGLILLVLMIRRSMSAARAGPQGVFGFGKSSARVHVEADTGVTFDDVAGAEEAVEELEEIVTFLTSSERYRRIGARIPKGALLVGPPGTGKTLLARAVAGRASVPFFSLSGSEFIEMFVGVGAARVRDLFRQAESRSPAIIFIDELDALAKSRDSGRVAMGHDEREQTLNQLLAEMDGFNPRKALIVLAATNRPEVIDPALLRPGRFDRQILVDKPDRRGRLAILKIHVTGIQLADDVDLESVAQDTPGFTGADLANVVNEAALLAARRNAETAHMQDFEEAIERVVAGLQRKSRRISEEEKRIVAHHESGHALAALMLPNADPVRKVSIISRGMGALGYTMQVPLEDKYLMRFEELRDRLTVLLAGRAAEQVVYDHISTGAADDLRKATEIARAMVVRFGMSEAVGPVSLQSEMGAGFLQRDFSAGLPSKEYSERTSEIVDREIRKLIDDALQRARRIIVEYRDVLERVARRLMEHEVVTQEELERIVSDRENNASQRRSADGSGTTDSRAWH